MSADAAETDGDGETTTTTTTSADEYRRRLREMRRVLATTQENARLRRTQLEEENLSLRNELTSLKQRLTKKEESEQKLIEERNTLKEHLLRTMAWVKKARSHVLKVNDENERLKKGTIGKAGDGDGDGDGSSSGADGAKPSSQRVGFVAALGSRGGPNSSSAGESPAENDERSGRWTGRRASAAIKELGMTTGRGASAAIEKLSTTVASGVTDLRTNILSGIPTTMSTSPKKPSPTPKTDLDGLS